MNRYKKSIIMVILLLTLSSTSVSTISAEATTHPIIMPSIIIINNVMKGTELGQEIIIENIEKDDHIVNISFIGEIESWVSFYPLSNKTVPITSISVTKNSYVFVFLKIAVPDETPNGMYYGNISVAYEDSAINGSGIIVKPTQKAPIRIQVTGEQIIDMYVERITTKDAEIGFPVVIEIDCKNNGNVIVTPKINIEFTLENISVGSITKSGKDLDPISQGQIKTYTIYWDTNQLVRLGNYTAFINITLFDKIIKQESKNFKIIKQGTLTRNGTLDELKFQQQPEKGIDAVLIAHFTNTGQIEIYAQFNATVYLNGAALHQFTSQQIMIPLYNKAEFKSSIPIPKDGTYEVKGHVYYYDTQNIFTAETEELKIIFTIGTAPLLGIDQSLLLPLVTIILLVVILILLLARYKKRSSTPEDIEKESKEPEKTQSRKTPSKRFQFAKNKEESPLKTYQEDNTQNEDRIKEPEERTIDGKK